jgi:NADP-dependent 3-hydroxy acid dehydrogenase YdfG
MRDPQGKNREHAARCASKVSAVVALDISDDASVSKAVDEVLVRAKRIDVLINNAGIASAGVTEAFTPDQAKIVFNTNVIGWLRATRAVLPAMRAAGDGLIVNIGSVLGRVTFPFFGIYGASKFAVEALTDSFRYELSQLGIDVVLVQPSAYPTNLYASIQQPAEAARAAAYGATSEIPGKMFATFTEMFSAPAPRTRTTSPRRSAKLVAQPRVAASPHRCRPTVRIEAVNSADRAAAAHVRSSARPRLSRDAQSLNPKQSPASGYRS